MLPRYYDLLSLKPDATVEQIAVARAALLAQYEKHAAHGDRDAIRLVRAIEDAAATLSDPTRRAAYDAQLSIVTAPALPPPQQALAVSTRPASPPARLAGPPPSPPALPATVADGPPAPVAFVLWLLEWLAGRAIALTESGPRAGHVLDGAPSLPTLSDGVRIGAGGWQFTVHDAFHTPALSANGQRLQADGHWLLVRVRIRNEWTLHQALRAEDFALLTSSDGEIPLHAAATHAARLVMGVRGTPAGRYGLGFAAREEKETVLVFDLPRASHTVFLRLKPAGVIVDLAPVAALPEADSATVIAAPPRLEILDVSLAPGLGRSRIATVTARATPGATCSIRVQYAHGASNARGLTPAQVGPDGVVRWSWRITPRTRPGEWPITVASGHTHALATVVVQPPTDAPRAR